MELRRNYREISLEEGKHVEIRKNNWIIRNFSLTGWYYNLSTYGHDLLKPTLFGIGIVSGSTLIWLTQLDPAGDFSFSGITGLAETYNWTQWQKALERSFYDFIPLLPVASDIKVGMLDFIFKIVGDAVTFGLIIIALRRKFERRFRH